MAVLERMESSWTSPPFLSPFVELSLSDVDLGPGGADDWFRRFISSLGGFFGLGGGSSIETRREVRIKENQVIIDARMNTNGFLLLLPTVTQ